MVKIENGQEDVPCTSSNHEGQNGIDHAENDPMRTSHINGNVDIPLRMQSPALSWGSYVEETAECVGDANLVMNMPAPPTPVMSPIETEFGSNFKILPTNNQIRELQTILRDKNTSRSDFKFYADRLIRLVIEESLNQLPLRPCKVTTPTGCTFEGLKYEKGNCGVSIVRSGEAMEQGLRDCCRSIRIGKILVESDSDTHEAHVVYARFPEDIQYRKVLLMYPILSTGNTVIKAVNVLKEHMVQEDNIILANLFCTPKSIRSVLTAFPGMKILTSEVHTIAPNHFGQRYFGTD